jgi:putative tricarboxylic transport membrane protein
MEHAMSDASSGAGPLQRSVEIGVAAATMLFGGIVVFGSLKAGIAWGVEGPKAGFFPFYVGLSIVIAGAVNAARAWQKPRPGGVFAEWSKLRSVLAVVIPTAIYVAVLPFLGIYLASFLLIAAFMKWLGRYRWGLTLAIAAGVPLLAFVTFEKWFLLPLPKGPIEDFLGL